MQTHLQLSKRRGRRAASQGERRQPNFEGKAWFDHVGNPGDRRQFIYLDRQWPSPNVWSVAVTRIVYNELGLLRLSPFADNSQMLMIVEPSACHLVDVVDWKPLWFRRSA